MQKKFKNHWISIGCLTAALGLVGCDGGGDQKEKSPQIPDSNTCTGNSLLEGASCFTFQGRESVVFKPAGEIKAIALLLHGSPGFPNKVMGIFDGKTLADKESFIAVAPKGSGGTWGWSSINSGSVGEDTEYLQGLINELKSVHNVTSDKVYILGYSAGGFMGYKLACQIPEELTTVVSLAGQYRGDFDNCSTSTPVAIHHFYSPTDSDVPMNGRSVGEIQSVIKTLEHWRAINGCDEKFEELNHDGVTVSSSGTTTKVWKECVKSIRFSNMNNVQHEASYNGEILYDIYKDSL